VNRDSIEERAGSDLYEFVLNAPADSIDILGLAPGLPNPVLPPYFPVTGPLSNPKTIPKMPPPVVPEPWPVPISKPPSAPPGSGKGDSTAGGACGGLEIAGGFMNCGSLNRAQAQAQAGCDKSPHSASGCAYCCIKNLTRMQNGPSDYYYTGGYGSVVNESCADAKRHGGIASQDSESTYTGW
jgi:hypothetical protein